MIRLAHPLLETVIPFEDGSFPALVIENRRFFRSYLQDIFLQIEGSDGEAVLSRDMEPILFSKNAELIDSHLSFTANRKTLLTKIAAALEQKAVSEAFYLHTAELMQELERFVGELTEEYTAGLHCTKLSIGSVLKAIGLSADDTAADLEQYLDYMELVREFDRDKVFIFVNLRSYYPDEELIPFLDTALAHEYRILLVDNQAYDLLPCEKRYIIDADLCEI